MSLYPLGVKMHITTSPLAWRISRYCNGSSSCVEFAEMADGNVALRDSKVEDGPVLVFTPEEWDAFTAGVRDGEFDLRATPVGK